MESYVAVVITKRSPQKLLQTIRCQYKYIRLWGNITMWVLVDGMSEVPYVLDSQS